MEVIAIPQTPNRLMGKKFNKLYLLNKELNKLLKNYHNDIIDVLQIFYDTEIPKDSKTEFLKLRDGILQVVIPFDWDTFSKLDENVQNKQFISTIQKTLNETLIRYEINTTSVDTIFYKFNRNL
jgi:hypothetical protein